MVAVVIIIKKILKKSFKLFISLEYREICKQNLHIAMLLYVYHQTYSKKCATFIKSAGIQRDSW